jgi:hypothetical protein
LFDRVIRGQTESRFTEALPGGVRASPPL